MLVVPSDGLEAWEILLRVEELEPGSSGLDWTGPPLGVREGTKPAFGAEIIVLTRLHIPRGGGGCPPSPPVHLLPPLLDNLTVGKLAPARGHEPTRVSIPTGYGSLMLVFHVEL